MGNVYFPMDHTPDEWRAMARDRRRSEQESFDRSDTDGFLSQWASALTARLYDLCADVATQGGVWAFDALADTAGNVIEGARYVKTRYGWSWVTPDGQWFTPSRTRDAAVARARNLAKGFQVVRVDRPAVVVMADGGGGMASAHPIVIPRRTSE